MTYNFRQKLLDVVRSTVEQQYVEVLEQQQDALDEPKRLKIAFFGFGQSFFWVEPNDDAKR